MAVLQTGITLTPSAEQVSTDYNGALEHVARHSASCALSLAQAVERHINHPAIVEARTRTDIHPGQHSSTKRGG